MCVYNKNGDCVRGCGYRLTEVWKVLENDLFVVGSCFWLEEGPHIIRLDPTKIVTKYDKSNLVDILYNGVSVISKVKRQWL